MPTNNMNAANTAPMTEEPTHEAHELTPTTAPSQPAKLAAQLEAQEAHERTELAAEDAHANPTPSSSLTQRHASTR
jgi:hypothetical protein